MTSFVGRSIVHVHECKRKMVPFGKSIVHVHECKRKMVPLQYTPNKKNRKDLKENPSRLIRNKQMKKLTKTDYTPRETKKACRDSPSITKGLQKR